MYVKFVYATIGSCHNVRARFRGIECYGEPKTMYEGLKAAWNSNEQSALYIGLGIPRSAFALQLVPALKPGDQEYAATDLSVVALTVHSCSTSTSIRGDRSPYSVYHEMPNCTYDTCFMRDSG